MSKAIAYAFYPYSGYILVKLDHAIGLGQKKYGGRDYVDHWLPLPNIGHIVYATGVKSADLFINQLVREIEIPEWLAREKGII